MMDTAARKRLINAIVYFAKNTKYCGKIKLFKLLYLLDFEHFRQTGKPAIGLDYQAWTFGPVPVSLMDEWEDFGPDLARAIRVEEQQVFDHSRQQVVVNEGMEFDADDFTPRQLRIMQDLVSAYRGEYSPKLIDETHTENGAWDSVWQGGKGAYHPIPYHLAVKESDPNRDALLEIAERDEQYRVALQASREGTRNSKG